MAKPIQILSRLPQIAGVSAICVGIVVLIGWTFDFGVLKGLVPGLATMKANTAFAFLFSGASLSLFLRNRGPLARYAGLACAFIAFSIGFVTFVEYCTRWNPGFDQILFRDLGGGLGSDMPGRPSPATAVIFLLVGAALPFLSDVRRRWLADTFLLVALEIAFLAVLGYLYGAHSLYQIPPYSSVALHTAVTSVLLCLGCLFAWPELGVAAIFVSDSVGGLMARRLLPAILGIIALLAWFGLKGHHAGFYGLEAGLALLTAANSTVLTALIWWRTRRLSRIDEQRRLAEDALRKGFAELEDRVSERTAELSEANAILSHEIAERNEMERALRGSQARFAGILDIAEDAVISLDQDQRIILFNQGAEKIFGYAGRDILGQAIDPLLPQAFRTEHRKWVAEFGRSPQITRRMAERTLVHGVRKDGSEFPAEASISRLEQDGHQTFTVMLRDITERRRAEEALQRSLNEKETLLKEIHHRVKNNLQVVSSLLSLQAASIGSKPALQVFQDSQGRIQSMALIHEQLYKSKDLSSIDFGDYLK
ncbi:MAG TPA: histidine kinase dimerization/phosphoacceptor domain -containing protein, partial [Blastocatellia bacterium]|nr:histidine kinase dimerization/phosphoacceptor domain -containing protein [Blastocatellia bacterium]